MNKKIVALVLCGLMVLSLFAGCGTSNQSAASSGQAQSAGSADQAQPAEVEEVTMAYFSFGVTDDTPMIEEKVNEITESKIGVHVNLNPIEAGQFMTQQNMLVSGSSDIDLMVTAYSAENIESGAFADLTDLLDEYGSGIKEVLGENLAPATYTDGRIYGLPNMHEYAKTTQIIYNADMAEAAGVDMSQVKTLADMDEVLAKVVEKYPDMSTPFLAGQQNTAASSNYQLWDNIGLSRLGVVFYDDPTQVVNLFETDEYRDFVTTLHDFSKKGYLNPDSIVSANSWTGLLESGMTFAVLTYNHELMAEEYTGLTGLNLGYVPLGESVRTTDCLLTFVWTILATSEKQEAAMKLLNLLYTDAEVENLLCNGIEGVHYVLDDQGLCTYPEGVDESNRTYAPQLSWVMPNGWLIHDWEGSIVDYGEKMAAYNESAKTSPLYGFVFDASSVINEVTACNNVLSQYAPSTEEDGTLDVDEALAEMNQALKDAGLDAIIAEKQRQVDEFYANQQ